VDKLWQIPSSKYNNYQLQIPLQITRKLPAAYQQLIVSLSPACPSGILCK